MEGRNPCYVLISWRGCVWFSLLPGLEPGRLTGTHGGSGAPALCPSWALSSSCLAQKVHNLLPVTACASALSSVLLSPGRRARAEWRATAGLTACPAHRRGPGCSRAVLLAEHLLHRDHLLGHLLPVQLLHHGEWPCPAPLWNWGLVVCLSSYSTGHSPVPLNTASKMGVHLAGFTQAQMAWEHILALSSAV